MEISINDLRLAIMYVQGGRTGKSDITKMSDDELLRCDFNNDFHFGNIRVLNVIIELERTYGFCLPLELFRTQADNTVRSLLELINQYLKNVA